MPTPMDYARAAAQAGQKGDTEAQAYFRQKATEAYQAEAPKATEGMGGVEKFRAGVGQGIVNTGRQVGNMLGLRSDEQLAEDKARDADLLATGAGRAGSFVGEMAATAPIGLGAGGVAGRVGLGLTKRALLTGALEGAAQGAVAGGPDDRVGSAVQGAGMGLALPGAGAALRKAARPLAASAGARRLIDKGVRLTPGEINPTGRLNQWEQALQSSAFGGTSIRNARDRATHDFRRVVAETASPQGTKLRHGLSDQGMLQDVEGAYGRGYEDAIGGYTQLEPRIINTVGPDVPLHTYPGAGKAGPRGAMVDATRQNYPGQLVKPQDRVDILGALDSEMSALPKQGYVSGRDLQGVRSNIRAMARGTDVAGERALLRGGEGKVTQALESQLNPDDLAKLQALDSRYGNFKILQRAVASAKDAPGGYTPNQLQTAIRQATDLGEYARGGGGPLRPLARAGREVFDQRVQPTGERQVLTGFFGRAGTPFVGGALAAGTKVPAKVLAGMTPAQRKLQSKLRALRRSHTTDINVGRNYLSGGLVQREKLQEERGED